MHTNGSRNSLSGQHHAAARPLTGARVISNPIRRLRTVISDNHNDNGHHNGDGHHNAHGNQESHGHNGRAANGPRLSGTPTAGRATRASDDRRPCPASGRSLDDPRLEALRVVVRQMKTMSWTPALFALVLDELYADDLFTELVGDPNAIPQRGYAHAVAVAIALRHSWRLDDLQAVAGRLGIVQALRKRRDPECAERRPRAHA